MDGLALLCNPHADGPVSLRRLRRSGVQTLRELARVPESSLASVLHASPTLARRLQHEADALDERLLERPLEPELVTPGDDASAILDPVEPDQQPNRGRRKPASSRSAPSATPGYLRGHDRNA